MPDITMCSNSRCSKALDCFRFLAIPSQWQSFFANVKEEDCTHFCKLLPSDRTVMNKPVHEMPDYVRAALELKKQKF